MRCMLPEHQMARITSDCAPSRSSVASNPEFAAQFAWAIQLLASGRLI